jgi:4-hydroxy-tetrahydrodipicolinate synthase
VKPQGNILYTAIVTPLEKGKVHFTSLEKLLRIQESAGNGVVLLGSTGEGMAFDEQTKKEIVRFARGLRLNIPLLAGVPGHQLSAALDWVGWCREEGIDGFLSVMPYYSKPGLKGQVQWFRSILDAAQKPVMVYNVPGRTAAKLNPKVLTELKGHGSLWAVKESSGSVLDFQDYANANTELEFYCGDDGLMPFFAAAGAIGLVSVASNVWPKATRRIVELSLQGKARPVLSLWREATDSLFCASNPVPTKALLHMMGQIPSSELLPPLHAEDLPKQNDLVRLSEKIANWERSGEL